MDTSEHGKLAPILELQWLANYYTVHGRQDLANEIIREVGATAKHPELVLELKPQTSSADQVGS